MGGEKPQSSHIFQNKMQFLEVLLVSTEMYLLHLLGRRQTMIWRIGMGFNTGSTHSVENPNFLQGLIYFYPQPNAHPHAQPHSNPQLPTHAQPQPYAHPKPHVHSHHIHLQCRFHAMLFPKPHARNMHSLKKLDGSLKMCLRMRLECMGIRLGLGMA